MTNQPVLIGAGGLIVGVFVGLGIGGSLVGEKIDAAVARALGPLEETMQEASPAEALAAIEERISALETQLAETASRGDEMSAAAREQLDSLQATLSERIDSVVEATGEQATELRTAVSDILDSMRAPAEPEADAGDAIAAGDAPSGLPEGESVAVGKTALFADGSVRAFVSRLGDDTARVSVNGELVSLGVGQAVPVSLEGGDCVVVLQGMAEDGAVLTSNCGAPGAAGTGETPENGFRTGQTAVLADGALRVFVSSLADDGSAARIAINGIDTQTVAAGETVEAGDCSVTVTGVGGGAVGLEGSCQ